MRHITLPFFLFAVLLSSAQEICDNGIDDDGDLLIDLNDTVECFCTGVAVDTSFVPFALPNPSFECYASLPTTLSQMNSTCDWKQGSMPTTDYFVNQTGGYFPAGLGLLPLPDGNACAGGFYVSGWQEYFGVCLTDPLLTGHDYRFKMQVAMKAVDGGVTVGTTITLPNTEVVIYGSNSCVPLPLGTTDCPSLAPVSPVWDVLGTASYAPSPSWQQIQIDFTTSEDYEMIMIGPPCTLDGAIWAWETNGAPYMFYDALQMGSTTVEYDAEFSTAGTLCNNELVLQAHPDTASSAYQWFAAGVAIPGETDTSLAISGLGMGPGTYQFQFAIDSADCALGTIEIPYPQYPDPNPGPGNVIGCAPMFVSFTNNADPALIGTTFWEFGNGVSTTLTDPGFTFTDTGTYQVSVVVTSPDGCIGTDTIYVDVDLCTGVNANEEPDGTHAWFSGEELFVRFTEKANSVSIELFDVTGRELISEKRSTNGTPFTLEQHLPPGAYTITINAEGKLFTTRVVKTDR